MATVLQKISDCCDYLFNELSDERTRDDWPSAGTIMTILFSYLYFCTKLGPDFMKNRKPYNLTRVIFYYNIFQIIASTYIFVEGFSVIVLKYNLACQPVVYINTPETRKMHHLTWTYGILKLIELLDTVFFVLRKKDRQVSSLHLYHHFMMPICAFLGYKYYPNGHSMSLGLVNSFVHIIMYTYYLIAGLGPKYQNILWWKKYVTILQLVQFLIIFVHNMIPLFIGCDYPRWINVSLSISALHFVYMFGSFYYVNYIKTPKKDSENVQKIK